MSHSKARDAPAFAAKKQQTLTKYFGLTKKSANGGESGSTPVTTPNETPGQRSREFGTSDPSSWRSRLPPETEITKGDVHSLYRLTAGDIEDLTFAPKITKDGYPYKMYREREVEHKAWEKHGGPIGWNAYLARLKINYLKRHGSADGFPQPLPPDKKIRIANTFHRQEANLKRKIPTWLWDQLQGYFHYSPVYRKLQMVPYLPGFDSRAERLDMLRSANVHGLIKTFPARKDAPIPDSASFVALQDLLADAPITEYEVVHNRNMSSRLVKTRWEGNILYDWPDQLKQALMRAVEDVVREHDHDDNTYKCLAAWMVYDKYAESLKPFGIYFARNTMEELGHWKFKAVEAFGWFGISTSS